MTCIRTKELERLQSEDVTSALQAGVNAMKSDKMLSESVSTLQRHIAVQKESPSFPAATKSAYMLMSALWAAILKLESAL